jgi:hypothetical protein
METPPLVRGDFLGSKRNMDNRNSFSRRQFVAGAAAAAGGVVLGQTDLAEFPNAQSWELKR